MTELPPERVPHRIGSFESTGKHFSGPIQVKFLRRSLKRWCCLFPCLATRAVRIQIVLSLNVVHPDRSFTRDVELTIAALVLVSRSFLWCNVSKIGETCNKTAPSVIEQRNFFWGPRENSRLSFSTFRFSPGIDELTRSISNCLNVSYERCFGENFSFITGLLLTHFLRSYPLFARHRTSSL